MVKTVLDQGQGQPARRAAADADAERARWVDVALPEDVLATVPALRDRCEDDVARIARCLVHWSIVRTRKDSVLTRRSYPPTSVVNRRLRAAIAWLRGILDGRSDAQALRDVARVWVPTLLGGSRADEAAVRACVDYVRGALTAAIFARAADNLLPDARLLYALETILAAHAQAARGLALRQQGASL
jgi:hypothetical protein